jgi:hypothetical protein
MYEYIQFVEIKSTVFSHVPQVFSTGQKNFKIGESMTFTNKKIITAWG